MLRVNVGYWLFKNISFVLCFRKEEPYFENSDLVVMPQDNGIQSSEIDLTDNPGEDQTYSLQQPIFLNQIPIIQNQQLVYQVEGVQNINNLNFTNGTTQQNFVYIVIPTTNENVQIESLPLDILKKDKPDGFRSASFEKSNSDAIKQELNGGIVSSEDHPESNANIDKFLHATPVDPLQVSLIMFLPILFVFMNINKASSVKQIYVHTLIRNLLLIF